MDFIKITYQLPPFGKRVIFRGIITWKNKNQVKFFGDELTHDEEILEYGLLSYVLRDNSDFIVCDHPDIGNLYDEFVTHWCEIPSELD